MRLEVAAISNAEPGRRPTAVSSEISDRASGCQGIATETAAVDDHRRAERMDPARGKNLNESGDRGVTLPSPPSKK
jgi:hypothetical protein